MFFNIKSLKMSVANKKKTYKREKVALLTYKLQSEHDVEKKEKALFFSLFDLVLYMCLRFKIV